MFKSISHFLKLYFGFSRRESRGFLLVLPSLLLLYSLPYIYNRINDAFQGERYERYFTEANLIAAQLADQAFPVQKTTSETQDSVGTGQKRADTKGKGTSLQKPRQPSLNALAFHETDSIVLQMVSGVGPVISARIITFRERLGGFHSPNQLLEVYGMTEELAEKIYALFPFQPNIKKKLALNDLSAKELADHPYIRANEAKVIIAFRNQHGSYQTAQDLLKIKVFNEDWLSRLEPYLSF